MVFVSLLNLSKAARVRTKNLLVLFSVRLECYSITEELKIEIHRLTQFEC